MISKDSKWHLLKHIKYTYDFIYKTFMVIITYSRLKNKFVTLKLVNKGKELSICLACSM